MFHKEKKRAKYSNVNADTQSNLEKLTSQFQNLLQVFRNQDDGILT
jgi:hypothetical protein